MHYYIMPCVNLYKRIQTYMSCKYSYSYCILFVSLAAELPTVSLECALMSIPSLGWVYRSLCSHYT